MTKTIRNNQHKKKRQSLRIIKRSKSVFSIALSLILIAVILIITISIASATSSAQQITASQITATSVQPITTNLVNPPNGVIPIEANSSEAQFNLNIAYAYAGKGLSNASYTTENGATMYPVSLYPSSVVLNSTRLPGARFTSCDAEIELYNVQIDSNKLMEHYCYFIGTNYKPSFSSSELGVLCANVTDFVKAYNFSSVTGNFEYNITDNTAYLSSPIGSVECYSGIPSGQGLWSLGKPDILSVTVQRIGYITITNGAVTIYWDTSRITFAMTNLNSYGTGFLHNDLISTAKLPQTNLFHPIAKVK